MSNMCRTNRSIGGPRVAPSATTNMVARRSKLIKTIISRPRTRDSESIVFTNQLELDVAVNKVIN